MTPVVGPSPGPSTKPQSWRKHLTLQNAGILAVLLFQAGQVWEGQRNTNASLNDEVKLTRELVKAIAQEAANTYVRRDVLGAELAAIQQRLTSIESAVRSGK